MCRTYICLHRILRLTYTTQLSIKLKDRRRIANTAVFIHQQCFGAVVLYKAAPWTLTFGYSLKSEDQEWQRYHSIHFMDRAQRNHMISQDYKTRAELDWGTGCFFHSRCHVLVRIRALMTLGTWLKIKGRPSEYQSHT